MNFLDKIKLYLSLKIPKYKTYYINVYRTNIYEVVRTTTYPFNSYEEAINAIDHKNSIYIRTIRFKVKL